MNRHLRIMKSVAAITLFSACAGNASAGYVAMDATITNLANTSANQKNFAVMVSAIDRKILATASSELPSLLQIWPAFLVLYMKWKYK